MLPVEDIGLIAVSDVEEEQIAVIAVIHYKAIRAEACCYRRRKLALEVFEECKGVRSELFFREQSFWLTV